MYLCRCIRRVLCLVRISVWWDQYVGYPLPWLKLTDAFLIPGWPKAAGEEAASWVMISYSGTVAYNHSSSMLSTPEGKACEPTWSYWQQVQPTSNLNLSTAIYMHQSSRRERHLAPNARELILKWLLERENSPIHYTNNHASDSAEGEFFIHLA